MAETVTPDVGDLVYDTKRVRVGEVMGYQAERALRRPVGEGIDWEVNPDEFRPTNAHECLRAHVNEMNEAVHIPTHSVWRFVNYTISHVREGGVTWEVFCAAYGCEDSHIADRENSCSEWAMRHTARTGHDLFRRACTDHARVTSA